MQEFWSFLILAMLFLMYLVPSLLLQRDLLRDEQRWKRDLSEKIGYGRRLRMTRLWYQFLVMNAPLIAVVAACVYPQGILTILVWIPAFFCLFITWFPLTRPYFRTPVAAMIAQRLKERFKQELPSPAKGEKSIVLTNLLVVGQRKALRDQLRKMFPNVSLLSGQRSTRHPLDFALLEIQRLRAKGHTALLPILYVLASVRYVLSVWSELPRPIGSITAEVDLEILQNRLPRGSSYLEFLEGIMKSLLEKAPFSLESKDFRLHIVMIPIELSSDAPGAIYEENQVSLWDASGTHLEVKPYQPEMTFSTIQQLYYLMHVKGATLALDYGQALLAGFLSLSRPIRTGVDFKWFMPKPRASKTIQVKWDSLDTKLDLAKYDWESKNGLERWRMYIRHPIKPESKPSQLIKQILVENELDAQVGPYWSRIGNTDYPLPAEETFLRQQYRIFVRYSLYDTDWIETNKWDILSKLYYHKL